MRAEPENPRVGATWVFHRGSLGDSVLLWPALRALLAAGERVALVTDGDKARLAARELGVEAHDAEQRRFNAFWFDAPTPGPVPGVARVLWVGGDDSSPTGRTWLRNAAAMFPGALIETIPGRINRPAALGLARRFGAAPGIVAAPARLGRDAPIVAHVGAGSESKRWPMRHWAALVRARGAVTVLAGEVEAERFSAQDRAAFAGIGGRFIESLGALADAIHPAGAFIGADTGPTHLAAALGIPTIALFGPTDPDEWGPIGPCIRVLRSPARTMESIEPDHAAQVITDLRVR